MADGLGVLPWHIILYKYDIAFFLLNFYVRALEQVALMTLKHRQVHFLHVFFMLAINSRRLNCQLHCRHVPASTFIFILLYYFHLCLKIHALGERKSLKYHVNYLEFFRGLTHYIQLENSVSSCWKC